MTDSQRLAQAIDHTLLKPEATPSQIIALCNEAKENLFFGVCVNSRFVPLARQTLLGSEVKVVSVIGFPLGAMSTEAKAFETEWCVRHGADEIDMVIALGDLKEKNNQKVIDDVAAVVKAAAGKKVKVIIETSLLSEEEKVRACECALKGHAHFVKTSTGFFGGGASLEDLLLMKKVVGSKLEVKASGGIKTSEQALLFLTSGASRLGTSSGIALVKGLSSSGGY
jgi:deoxyribose-phosphate aldolase